MLALFSVVSTYEWSQVALMVEDDYYNRYASVREDIVYDVHALFLKPQRTCSCIWLISLKNLLEFV